MHAMLLALPLSLMLRMLQPADLVVVAHPHVRLTMSDVRDAYVGEKEFSGQIRLIPVDNTSVRLTFLERALSMNARQYETLWVKKAFRDALTPPASIASDADVLAFIARTPGAVGYVSSLPASAGVTIVGRP